MKKYYIISSFSFVDILAAIKDTICISLLYHLAQHWPDGQAQLNSSLSTNSFQSAVNLNCSAQKEKQEIKRCFQRIPLLRQHFTCRNEKKTAGHR
jgi:hypothetical protein